MAARTGGSWDCLECADDPLHANAVDRCEVCECLRPDASAEQQMADKNRAAQSLGSYSGSAWHGAMGTDMGTLDKDLPETGSEIILAGEDTAQRRSLLYGGMLNSLFLDLSAPPSPPKEEKKGEEPAAALSSPHKRKHSVSF